MSTRVRRAPTSLTECFEPRLYTYARLPKRRLRFLRQAVLARSPVHFVAGDMRHDYGWTRTLLTARATVVGLGLGARLLLTGLFVVLLSPDLPLLALFNLCVTLLLGRVVLDHMHIEPRTHRRIIAPRPWWVQPPTRPRRWRRIGRRRRHRRPN